MEMTSQTIKEAVFAERPVLKTIYQESGNQSVFDYVNQWAIPKISVNPLFLQILSKRLSSLYGQCVARAAIDQLGRLPLVSTIDHHGILNHPFFINSNLLFSFHHGLDYLICFSTAGVSMNNNSSWSGCLLYHDSDVSLLHKLPVVPHSRSMQTVFAAPALRDFDKEVFFTRLAGSSIGVGQKEILQKTIGKVFTENVFALSNFSDQAGVISYHLWQDFVPTAPKVLYVPLEDLVGDILCSLLEEKEELFSLLFCSQEGLQLINRYFHGNDGAFTSMQKGSFLFWGVDEKGKRIHLRLENQYLIGDNFSMQLNAESICGALRGRRIYPTSLVCFLVLLNFEMTCLGGFNQTTWLSEIKQKFMELLFELSRSVDIKKINAIPTANFAESSIAFLHKYGRLFQATGIDMLFEQDMDLYQKYRHLAQTITVAESMDISLPEIYRVIFPAKDRHGLPHAGVEEFSSQSNRVCGKVGKVFLR